MKKLGIGALLVTALLVGRAAHATTYVNYRIHGASCNSITSGVAPTVGPNGVNAPSSSSIDVTCPIILPDQSYTYGYIYLVGYNRSSTDNVSCTPMATDSEGNNTITSTATLTGNQAGSLTASASLFPTVANGNGYFSLRCHIPGHTANGYSHVNSIFLQVGY
jgi:hypothetical protein